MKTSTKDFVIVAILLQLVLLECGASRIPRFRRSMPTATSTSRTDRILVVQDHERVTLRCPSNQRIFVTDAQYVLPRTMDTTVCQDSTFLFALMNQCNKLRTCQVEYADQSSRKAACKSRPLILTYTCGNTKNRAMTTGQK